MLTKEVIKEIETKLGYSFKSKALLSQAFSRSSYAEEDRMHGGKGLSNEQLEFYGDSVLNYVIVNELTLEETTIDADGNIHTKTQEELTNFVSFWTDKTMLSNKMDKLGLNQYLLLGKGDIKQDVGSNKSAKEDLFESIVGAIWFDSNKDMKLITNIVYKLLDLNFDDICFKKNRYTALKEKLDRLNADAIKRALSPIKVAMLEGNDGFVFTLDRDGESIYVKGTETNDYHMAQIVGADEAIKYLEENFELLNVKKKIDPSTVTEANAVQKLTQLFQLKIIAFKPEYTEIYDYGSNVWIVKYTLADASEFVAADREKQVAKNKAALQAFKYAYNNAGKGLHNGFVYKF